MIKLRCIRNDALPIGWVLDKKYEPHRDTGMCLYRHITKGVVIIQLDYTGDTEKISVDSALTEFKPLKNYLKTLNSKEANYIALKIMEG